MPQYFTTEEGVSDMKKKIFATVLILAMIFAFSACGGGSGSSDTQDDGSAEGTNAELMGESTDLISCDAGEIKFVGFQKADPKLIDEENAYVFVYEYTNHQDDPSACQSTFWIQYFQNNTEITANNITYYTDAKEQYDLLQAAFNEALKDGTVRFGQIVLPKDDSPVTVMAKEQSNQDHYEMIEVNLSDGTVTGSGSKGSSSADADVEALIQGDWVLQEVNTFHFENGTVSLSQNGEEMLSGEYTINYDTSEIDGVFHASDKDTKIHLPFEVKDGTLHIFNNNGEEMIHQ